MISAYFNCIDFYRYLKTSACAIVITVTIFALMEKMVSFQFEFEEEENYTIQDVTFIPKPIENRKEIKIEDKPKIQEAPPLPDVDDMELQESEVKLTLNVHVPNLTGGSKGIDFSGMPVPISLVSPRYPNRAQTRGIEGFVDVKFDINKMGATENIQVVASSPEGVFEKSAMNAVKKWRFKPKMEGGEEKVYVGMVRRIGYEMED